MKDGTKVTKILRMLEGSYFADCYCGIEASDLCSLTERLPRMNLLGTGIEVVDWEISLRDASEKASLRPFVSLGVFYQDSHSRKSAYDSPS